MRRLGKVLAALGLALGALAGLAMTVPLHLHGWSWLLAVGVIKLVFAGSLGLIGTGAVLQRLARRAEERALLSAPSNPDTPSA